MTGCDNHPFPDCRPGGIYTGTPEDWERYCASDQPDPCLVGSGPVSPPALNPGKPANPGPVVGFPTPTRPTLPPVYGSLPLAYAGPGAVPEIRAPGPGLPPVGPAFIDTLNPGSDGAIEPLSDVAFRRGRFLRPGLLDGGRGPVVQPCTKPRCSAFSQGWLGRVMRTLEALA